MLQRPKLSLIGIARSPHLFASLPVSRQIGALRWPGEEARLVPMVIRVLFETWKRSVVRTIDGAAEVNPWLRAALRSILRTKLPPLDRPGSRALPTLKTIGEDIGRSPRRISKISRSGGIDLREVGKEWVALLSLILHEVEGVKWDHVALRAGYADVSGLSHLMFGVYNQWLNQLDGGGIEHGLRQFEALVQKALG